MNKRQRKKKLKQDLAALQAWVDQSPETARRMSRGMRELAAAIRYFNSGRWAR